MVYVLMILAWLAVFSWIIFSLALVGTWIEDARNNPTRGSKKVRVQLVSIGISFLLAYLISYVLHINVVIFLFKGIPDNSLMFNFWFCFTNMVLLFVVGEPFWKRNSARIRGCFNK